MNKLMIVAVSIVLTVFLFAPQVSAKYTDGNFEDSAGNNMSSANNKLMNADDIDPEPEDPEIPDEPETPEEPEIPEIPEEPSEPETPTEPTEPETPQTPEETIAYVEDTSYESDNLVNTGEYSLELIGLGTLAFVSGLSLIIFKVKRG